jgi:diguanylate cyclase (GGDEF)-like protein/PAS domain S-box-containing protein
MTDDKNFYKDVLDNLYDGIYFVSNDRTITYWNRGAGELTGYPANEAIGKKCGEIFRHVDNEGVKLCGDQCPVTQTLNDGRTREFDMFFHHKEGHLVPVSLRVAPVASQDRQLVVAVEIIGDSSPRYVIRQKLEQLEQLALCDSLTALANRRYLDINLSARIEELNRYGWSFGVLFMDIDHFKHINDTHGHSVGDKILKMVAKTLYNSVRPFDILGRWGGEEFVAILINVDNEHLNMIANRLRILVEQSLLYHDTTSIGATISIGGTLARRGDTANGLIQRADRLMYLSKKNGRNKVTIDSPTTAPP